MWKRGMTTFPRRHRFCRLHLGHGVAAVETSGSSTTRAEDSGCFNWATASPPWKRRDVRRLGPEHLVETEQQERTRRSLERRLLRSRLGRFTPMTDFDWAWPKRIDRALVEAVLQLDFLAGASNVVLVAPQGLGKTMIAQNIAHAAVLAGHHVLFKTAAEVLLDLGAQESARGLARRLNYYATRGVLVIDEIGYLSYDARAADLLFQVVSRRYERRSLVLTTNLPFSEWPSIFPNAATATALIDRVVHHAEIIETAGTQAKIS
jgi:DNA replication protein DnaC